ncbi:MAG: bifunctional phosphopantothenoylcysteine decarboxylase/phosphopantothenate--cysteine ligase CoaBC [Cyanobacteria bacterium P01_A01_bin.105]
MSAENRPQNILIAISGGIAAYKVCEVVSTLAKSDPPHPPAQVRVVLTDAAQAFVSALTFAGLSRHRAYTDADFWQANQDRPLHIELGEWADLILLAPLTANTLGKLTHGLADNLLTNTILASTCPVLLAPAMNTDMWQQVSVQRNWAQLQQDSRYHTVGPAAGRLACDRIGTGRMAPPQHILNHLYSLLHSQGQRDLAGKHLLISTGGTREYLDAVRFIGNPSTGRMGIALAQAATHRGARVTLVHGPLEPALYSHIPDAIQTLPAHSAATMATTLEQQLPEADWVIMAAAVADVRPQQTVSSKLPKSQLPEQLPLETVPDIVAQLAAQRQPHQQLIGFAAQTGEIVAPARAKLMRKGLNAIIANPIDQPNSGFGTDTNQAIFLSSSGEQTRLKTGSKLSIAHQILDCLVETVSSTANMASP